MPRHVDTLVARVQLADYRWATFQRATADQFEPDELTITSLDQPEIVLARYAPGQWRHVVVYGSDGYPDFVYVARWAS